MTRITIMAVVALAIAAFVQVPHDIPEPVWLGGRSLSPTYTGGAGIIYEHRCATCHREDGVGPMSLETLTDVRDWSVGTQLSMEDAISLRLMPPWPADPSVGSFANDLRMTEREVELLEAWIAAGYPTGDGEYVPPASTAPWSIGEPDAVFDLPPHTVAADAGEQLVESVLQTDYGEDRWIVAAEALPGSFAVVEEIDAGRLGQYRPGSSATTYRDGAGMVLEAGAAIRVRVRYRNQLGEQRTDQSRLAVRFATDSSAMAEALLAGEKVVGPVTLAAGEKARRVDASFTLPRAGRLYRILPAMGERGIGVRVKAILPDGTQIPILAVPRWDPLWQLDYQLSEPLDIPEGTRIEATATFDNSMENVRNPDPWSDATEAMTLRLVYSLATAR